MNRYLGSWSGSGALAEEMARVSNDPQFRQNPDQTQHAAIRAMGQQRDDAEFRRTIGDTARSRAFSGLDDRAQLDLMNRLGTADRATRDAYQQMWRSDEFQHAGLASQVGQLREFEQKRADADREARAVEDRAAADRREQERQEVERKEQLQQALDRRPDRRIAPEAAPPNEDAGPLPPGALLRATTEGARRVLPAPDAVRTPPGPPQTTGTPTETRLPPQPIPNRDHNGFAYRTDANGRFTLPADPTRATPRQFLENHVLPALREATNADGSPRYPNSVAEMERTLEQMRRAEASGALTTEWEAGGTSWAAGRYDANGDFVGTRAAVNAQLVQEWDNIEEAVRTGRMDPSQRLAHLHETAGRFMEDLSHEFAHRQGLRSQERIFDPNASREENVRRLTDDALADEASRARNGYRMESVFARESDRAGGYRPQRDHSIFQKALDEVRAGRLSPGEAQQRVIDHIADLRPGGHPPGTTYRDLYRENAETEYDRMMARHQARANDPNARPAQDPNARPAQDPDAVRRAGPDDLPARWNGEIRDVLRNIPEGGMPLDEFMDRLGSRELLDHPELSRALESVRGPDGSTRIMVDHRYLEENALAISQWDPDGTARMTFDRGIYAGPPGHVTPAMRTLSPEIAAAHEVFDMDYMRRAAETWREVEDGRKSYPDRYRQPVEDTLSRIRQENPDLINRMIDEDIRMYGRDGLFRDFADGRYADFNRQAELFRARTPQTAADLAEVRDAVWNATTKHRVMDYFRESNTYARQMDLYEHARALDPRYQSPAMERWAERIRNAADPAAERARLIEENLIQSRYVSRDQADVFRRYESMLPEELRARGRLAADARAGATDGRTPGDRPPPDEPPRRAAPGGMDDPNRPGSGAAEGRRIVDDVVRHKIDEAYRNGPEDLRNLRGQLGAEHQRMLDDMLVRFDGDAARLHDVLQRDTNLDPDQVRRKLEGFERSRALAAERERARLEDARRRADEVMRYPTTRRYLEEAQRGIADADRMIDEVRRAPDFEGRNGLLRRLERERDELLALTDRDRRLGDITDKNVGGARNNLRGYGEEWSDIRDRLQQGHRVQYGGGADVVDHTAREAIQHKASASNDPNQVRADLQKANRQLGGSAGERPPEGYRRVVNMTVEGDSHLAAADPGSAAHRQRLLDAAADAFRGQGDLSFDEVRFRYRGADGAPVDVVLERGEIEARIRARSNADGRGGDGNDGRNAPGEERPRGDGPDGRPAPDGRRADALHPDVRGALNRDVLDGLSQDDLRRVGALTEDAGARGSISDLLRNARTPEEARQILSTLEGVPVESRQAVAQAINAMGQGDLSQVHRMMQSLPAESREALGRVLGNLGAEQGADFLRIAQHLQGRELGEMMDVIDTAVSNLARHAPGMLDDVGRLFTAMNQMVSRLGLQMSQVAGRVLRGVGAMLPAVGTAFSAYDFARMTRVAADGTLPPELRFLGGAGMALNGLDTVLGVSEMFGIGNVGLPANLALGAAALGLDLYTHHQIDLFRQNPNGWQPSRELNAFVAGTALAMGPTGAALLVGTFGASGAEEKMIDLGHVGGELAINAVRLGGVAAADGVGGGLRFTARGIDAMAEMIRNPEQFGRVMQQLGVGAQQLAQNALTALGNATQYAGELGQRAARAIGQAGNWLVERGAEGLETLRWMARPENWPAMGEAAQRGITEMIRRGGELGRAAWDGLQDLGARGVEIGRNAITALQNAGERGLEMLNHAYQRLRDNPVQAFRDLGNAAIDGITNIARQGGELGQRAVQSLIDWVNDQPRLAQRAVTALRDLARQGGEALDQIATAWSRNLTEGGRAVLASLENLGDAGVEALARLGARGGQLAMEAANSLGRMVDRGYQAATQALQQVAQTLSPENLQRFLIEQPARAARAVFDALGGQRIAEMLNGLRNTPDMLRRLYDQMSWRHVRDAFGRLGDQALDAMIGALDPRRLREFIGHFDGDMLRRVWDATQSWAGARRLFETAGAGLTRKLADAIGPHRIAGLLNAANVSVDWIRTHLAQTLNSMQGFADLLQRTTAEGLRKLRDVVGVDRIAGTLRQMRDAGIQFGENLVNSARELGDRAIQEAMGLVQRVEQHVQRVADSYRGGRIVHPFHPDAVWWIGTNPFARR